MIEAVEDSKAHATASAADAHEHPPFLAHHFGSARQQFDAGKYGMWLFLITEILFFSGLFCAYAVFRRTHPQAFANADQFLDVSLGATNTAVLIFSSLTMACAVRAAQLGRQKQLVYLLTITLACASIFLGVKAIEYSHKWDTGVLWSKYFNPRDHAEHSRALLTLSIPAACTVMITLVGSILATRRNSPVMTSLCRCLLIASVAFFAGIGLGKGVPWLKDTLAGGSHHVAARHVVSVPGERAQQAYTQNEDEHEFVAEQEPLGAQGHETATPTHAGESEIRMESVDPVYTGTFFSIYFVMTGLHAIHIIAGMGVIAWLLMRSLRGHFGPDYFGPVDFVGLYWHLVDLIWIYLFPLLYLIG
jgi:cytochrome c oxidase subunit 3